MTGWLLATPESDDYLDDFDEVPPHPLVEVKLFPHQVEGISRMVEQERSLLTRGGILGDESGLGKTLQMIGVITRRIEDIRTTLIVCPSNVVQQWYNEMAKHAPQLSVFVYYGSQKCSHEDFESYNVILTTYGTLRSLFQSVDDCQSGECGAVFETQYPDAFGPARRDLWNRSLHELNFMLIDNGFEHRFDLGKKEIIEIIIANNLVVESQIHEDRLMEGSWSATDFHRLKWGRVVLDEAHHIRNPASKTARSAKLLRSNCRWCLSGNQPDIDSLDAYLDFLGLHSKFFDQKVRKPLKIDGISASRYQNRIKLDILDEILIRRTKSDCANNIGLQPPIIVDRLIELTPAERDIYNSLDSCEPLQFDTYARAGTKLVDMIPWNARTSWLRQVLNHPYSLLFSKKMGGDLVSSNHRSHKGNCSLCLDGIRLCEDGSIASCGHRFHTDCVKLYLKDMDPTFGFGKCPTCFKPLTLLFDSIHDSSVVFDDEDIAERLCAHNFVSSSKFDAERDSLSGNRGTWTKEGGKTIGDWGLRD